MIEEIRRAFLQASNGYSADRVVADPDLNARFLKACLESGLTEKAADLNLRLLNARKAGLLAGLPRSKTTSFPNEEEYRFASEVAARHLEHRNRTTLDRIICDPVVAVEFDSIAERLCSGHSPLEYRWAALNLRKGRRLQPELVAQVVPCQSTDFGSVQSIDTARLPLAQGIYIFYAPNTTLYIGEAENLRRRVGKHLDHSDNKGLARWFWENQFSQVFLEIRLLASDTTTRVRKALEADLIRSRRPVFNVQNNSD